LMPVTDETLEQWRLLYNSRMQDVPNASYMTSSDAQKMRSRGDGYFVHSGEKLLGIGIASGDKIQAIASCAKGAGERVLLALCHALSGDSVELEVASANERAVRLYERLGFLKIRELARWYQIWCQ